MKRIWALVLSALLTADALCAAVRAVTPAPPRVQAPLTALGGMLGQSLTLTTPQLPASRLEQLNQPTLALPQPALSIQSQGLQAAAVSAPGSAPNSAAQVSAVANELLPKAKARAVLDRITNLEIQAETKKGRMKDSHKQFDPKKGADPLAENGESPLGILQKVNAVFEDYSPEEIRSMPAEDLAALAGAVLEQSRQKSNAEVLPGYHAAKLMAERKNARLLEMRGKAAPQTITRQGQKIDSFNQISNEAVPATVVQVEGRPVFRHYTTQDGWRRMVETATLKNGVMPYVIYGGADKETFPNITGAFLTIPKRDPTNVGVPRDNAYYVDLQVPAGIPVLQIEKDNIYVIPLPASTHGWVKEYFEKFLAGTPLETYYRSMVEAMAKFGGPGPDVHVPIRLVGAGTPSSKRPLSLAGLRLKGSTLYNDGAKLEFVGAGEWGRVFVHPADSGAVVKVAFGGGMSALVSGTTPEEAHDADLRMSLRLAEAGAGPQVLGSGHVAVAPGTLAKIIGKLRGRAAGDGALPAIVKERVSGETVEALIRKKKFGEEEYALVSAMLDKMAEAGIKAGDLRLSNLMIGTTKGVKERRALVVDGGGFFPVAPGTTAAQLRADLSGMLVHAGFIQMGDRMPSEQLLIQLDQLLRDGVKRSTQGPFWRRGKKA